MKQVRYWLHASWVTNDKTLVKTVTKSKGEEEKKSKGTKGSCKGFRVKRKRINHQNNKNI